MAKKTAHKSGSKTPSGRKKDDGKRSRRSTLIRIAGALVGILLIAVLLYNTDINSLLRQIRALGWSFSGVILVTFFAYLIAVLAWALSYPQKIRMGMIPTLFGIRLVGESLAQVNPTNIVAGETLKMILVKRIYGISYRDSGLSVMISRTMMVLASCFVLFVGAVAIFQVFDLPVLHKISLAVCVIVGCLFAYTFWMLRKGHGVFSVFAKGLRRLFGRFAFVKKAVTSLLEVDADMVLFYKAKRLSFYSVFALSVLMRLVGSLEYYVILTALGIDVTLFTCVLFDVVSTIIRTSGFFIPGQVGLEEAGNKLMFSLVKVPGAETWLTVSLVRRARQVFWILAGFALYFVISRITGRDFSKEGVTDEDTLRHA
jgi:uncharacterized protein (TIRG00374 family)